MQFNIFYKLILFATFTLIYKSASLADSYGIGYGQPNYISQGFLRYYPIALPKFTPPIYSFPTNNHSYNSGNQYIGKKIIDNESEKPYSGGYILESSLPNPYRIIKPGMVVTTDFIKNRLNLYVDDDNVVTRTIYG